MRRASLRAVLNWASKLAPTVQAKPWGNSWALSGTTWPSDRLENRFLEAGKHPSPCPRHRAGGLGVQESLLRPQQ